MSILRLLVLVLVVVGLSGCGTRYATVPNEDGESVMLLGHDPVAYFTKGAPVRGLPEFKLTLPDRTYYFESAANRDEFKRNTRRYEPQYGGFCASGAAYALKLGSDPTAWQIHDGRLFIFGDVLGKLAWQLDPRWNIDHADRLWPDMHFSGWRSQSLSRYAFKVPHYKTGAQIVQEWKQKDPAMAWPAYDPGGMVTNLFLKPPGWRAAEGFGQPAMGYPK